MVYRFPPDIEELVRQRIASGSYSSEDDVLREALLALAAAETDFEAVQSALADIEAGDPGIPLDDAFDMVRQKYQISDE